MQCNNFSQPPTNLQESLLRRKIVQDSLYSDGLVVAGGIPFATFDGTATGNPSRIIYEASSHLVHYAHGNSHGQSYGGRSSLELYHGAHHAIRKIIGAKEEDLIWLTGNGTTGAVHKFIELIGAKYHAQKAHTIGWDRNSIPTNKRPLFITSLKEHHSNDLPFMESIGELRYINFREPSNDLDLDHLEQLLKQGKEENRPYIVVSIQGASNVDGSIIPMDEIAKLAHKNDAFVGFDLATYGSHAPILARPGDDSEAWPDFLFYSTHKLVGLGLDGNPGILYVSTRLLDELKDHIGEVPVEVGGDTVLYTSNIRGKYTCYLKNKQSWIGGSDNIGGAVRAALGLILREWVGWEAIEKQEQELHKTMMKHFTNFANSTPSLRLLGTLDLDRLPVYSFIAGGINFTDTEVEMEKSYVDYRLASRWLHDSKGVQVREGCACAGKYGARLLEIPCSLVERIIQKLESGDHSVKPGWTRATVDWTLDNYDLEYLVESLDALRCGGEALKKEYRQLDTGCFVAKKDEKWSGRFCVKYSPSSWSAKNAHVIQGFLDFAKTYFGV